MKIVVVDDNASLRKLLGALFENQGHQVVASLENGAGLLDCVRRENPDLVCLDYNLPGRNGLELLTELHQASPETSAVMISASDDPALNGRAADAGASGFLHKPFSQTQIIEELRHIEDVRKISYSAVGATDVVPAIHRRTAVIVDDSGAVCLLLKGILEGIGLTVVESAATGERGVAAAAKHHPEVLCLDVEMPVMSGLQALPLIHKVSPKTKVVMVTGNPNKSFVEAAIADGAKGYLLKPVRPSHVEEFMRKLLGL